MYRSHVLVCGGTGCTSSGSQQIIKVLQEEIDKNGLTEEVAVVQTGCHGLCAQGPIMLVYPEGTFYAMVKAEDVPEKGACRLFLLAFCRRSVLRPGFSA